MELYALFNEEKGFICKKRGLVFVSHLEIDKINTYRRKADANHMLSDIHYWQYRHIDKDEFRTVKINLNIEVIPE